MFAADANAMLRAACAARLPRGLVCHVAVAFLNAEFRVDANGTWLRVEVLFVRPGADRLLRRYTCTPIQNGPRNASGIAALPPPAVHPALPLLA